MRSLVHPARYHSRPAISPHVGQRFSSLAVNASHMTLRISPCHSQDVAQVPVVAVAPPPRNAPPPGSTSAPFAPSEHLASLRYGLCLQTIAACTVGRNSNRNALQAVAFWLCVAHRHTRAIVPTHAATCTRAYGWGSVSAIASSHVVNWTLYPETHIWSHSFALSTLVIALPVP